MGRGIHGAHLVMAVAADSASLICQWCWQAVPGSGVTCMRICIQLLRQVCHGLGHLDCGGPFRPLPCCAELQLRRLRAVHEVCAVRPVLCSPPSPCSLSSPSTLAVHPDPVLAVVAVLAVHPDLPVFAVRPPLQSTTWQSTWSFSVHLVLFSPPYLAHIGKDISL